MPYSTDSLTGSGGTETVGTGATLNQLRRLYLGFELGGGVTWKYLWARLGIGVGWDVNGTTQTRVTLDGTPGTLSSSGIASAITASAGVAIPSNVTSVGIGPFASYVLPTATFDPGGAPQGASGHLVVWGGEIMVERRFRRNLLISTSFRLGADLSVQGMLGLSFE